MLLTKQKTSPLKTIALSIFIAVGIFTAISFTPTISSQVSAITNPVIGTLGDDAEAAATGEVTLNYFAFLWRALINMGGLVVIVYYIWGAFEWITASGDSGKLDKARLKMVHATIGLIILVSSFTIVGFIGTIAFGDQFNIMELSFPTYD